MIRIYTDGACKGNPGPGGWAWAVPGGAFASGAAADTTNQRMEVTAAFRAVEDHEGDIEVISDSTYVVHCFRDRWWEGWIARGWKNKAGKPVANRDLWEPFIALVRDRTVRFTWVKGHSGDPMNDYVDALAVDAAANQRGRSGAEPVPVDDLDVPVSGKRSTGGGTGAVVRADSGIAGRLVAVVGHRPPELGGYDVDNPVRRAVRRKMAEILAAKVSLHPDLAVLTGLDLGAEQVGADAAGDAGVPYVAVVPFPDFDGPWPDAARRRYADLLDGAREIVTLERKAPDSKQKFAGALRRRDAWLARTADEAIVVWDRSDDRLGRLARSLDDALDADVWYLDPTDQR